MASPLVEVQLTNRSDKGFIHMTGIPNKFSHLLYSGIQSGMTCAIAAGISSMHFYSEGTFINHWTKAYLFSWMVMLPLVLVAAPLIRKIVGMLTT